MVLLFKNFSIKNKEFNTLVKKLCRFNKVFFSERLLKGLFVVSVVLNLFLSFALVSLRQEFCEMERFLSFLMAFLEVLEKSPKK